MTALARYTLRTAAARRRSPAAILRWVGEAMLDQDAAGGRFCTIACAHVDLARSPARLTVVLRRAPAAGAAARGRRRSSRSARRARCSGSLRRPGAAGPQHRPAPGRHARALHRRADRGAGAARRCGASRSSPPRSAPRRWTGRTGSSTSLVASALGDRAAPRDDLAMLALKLDLASSASSGCPWPCRRRFVSAVLPVRLAALPLRRALGRRIIDLGRLLLRISDIRFSGLHSRYLPPIGDVASRVRHVGSAPAA